MGLEQIVNHRLNQYPGIKRGIKRIYQRAMYAISPKIKSEGEIIRISPEGDGCEYFFGYYDKSPWDKSDRYMLCMRARDASSDVSPREVADIILIDTEKAADDLNRVKKIAETRAWNVQQGCMLQWLGPDYSSRVLYNDYRKGKYVSVILTLQTMEEQVIPSPVYTVSKDGKFALTLDFSRLYNLRPGYGYYNVVEKTKGIALPDSTAVWRVDFETGKVTDILKYTDFAGFQPRIEMQEKGTVHKVNHLMLSPNGKRFMVLYRWFKGKRKYTRLITCNVDGTDMYVLSDDDMVSHCVWKNDSLILAFENKKGTGCGYYLMKDKTEKFFHCWPQLTDDGHPSYSPNGCLIVTDSYPDRTRMSSLKLMDGNERKKQVNTIAKVFAPFKYDNDTRCDLHPRWNHKGDKICFDSVFEGCRGLYVVDISGIASVKASHETSSVPKYSIITPMYNSFKLMKRYFESLEYQTFKDFEVIIIDDCSTDGSYENACKYALKTGLNLSVYRTDCNAGPGNARNVGMDKAKGKWITFIDNDDWVEKYLLKRVDDIIKKNSANCIIYDYYISDGKKHKAARSMYAGEKGFVSIEQSIALVRNHTVGKFYELSICREKGIRFPILNRCEDVAFVARAIEACRSVYYIHEPMYYYYQRPLSLSNSQKFDETDLIKAFNILEDELGDKYSTEIKEKSVPDLLYGGVLTMCKAGKSNREIIDFISAYERKYNNWNKADIINYLGRGKRIFLKFVEYKSINFLKLMSNIHTKLIEGKA